MDDDERQETYSEFTACVNMAPTELEDWLQTDEPEAAGDKGDGGESTATPRVGA